MTTIFRGTRPPELQDWLDRRRRLGQDRRDEVWEGRYVVAPDPDGRHGEMQIELCALLTPVAQRLGLRRTTNFNLGDSDNFRVPDAGLLPGPLGVWHDTAVVVVEVLSPEDETFAKLDFYTAHGVQELLVADWRTRTIRCFAMQEGQQERDRSEVLEATMAELEEAIDWPPLD